MKAFEQSAPGDYDMILMDVQMPVMNGYEATKAIRRSSHELAKTIPIIAMTISAGATLLSLHPLRTKYPVAVLLKF